MGPRPGDARFEPLEIEVLEGGDLETQEVRFGTRRPPGPSGGPRVRPVWIVLGALAGVAAIVVVGATAGDEPSAGPPTTSEPPATSTSTTVEPERPTTVAPVTAPPATPVPSLSPIVVGTAPRLVEPTEPGVTAVPAAEVPEGVAPSVFEPGWRIYLWDTAGGPAALVAYEPLSGKLTEVDLGPRPGPLKSIVFTGRGPAVDAGTLVLVADDGLVPVGWGDQGITDFTSSGPRLAPGPEGLVWVRTLNPAGLALFDPATGRNLGRYELPLGVELIGSTESGSPVVRGPDLVSYEIRDDGTSVALPGGITTAVEGGRYADLRCSPPSECLVSLHNGALAVSYEAPGAAELERTSLRFAPDGLRVAVAVDGRVRLLTTLGGGAVDVPVAHVPSGAPVSRPAVNYLRLAHDLVWTPDGDHLGLLTEAGLVFVGVDGEAVLRIVIDPDEPLRYVPLAVG